MTDYPTQAGHRTTAGRLEASRLAQEPRAKEGSHQVKSGAGRGEGSDGI